MRARGSTDHPAASGRVSLAVALFLGLLLASGAAAAAPGGAVVERELVLMGTRLRLAVEAEDRAAALAASEAAVAVLVETEARLSTWSASSELARLNRAATGEAIALSPRLVAELAAARRCAELTAGAFDPTVGALAEAWGLRSGGRLPGAQEIVAARQATGFEALELGPGALATKSKSGLRVEEGGFGKGAGLDRVTEVLAGRVRSARLDLGGQILLVGESRERQEPVADPDDREAAAVAVRMAIGSLSTSGNSERSHLVGGQRVGHLLDPRRGTPAPDFGSLTVWAPTGLIADCLSTGLFVLGPEAALTFAREHPEIGVLVLERLGEGRIQARTAGALDGRVRAVSARVELVAPANRDRWSQLP